MPSAIKLKKLTASNWTAENEAESEEKPSKSDDTPPEKSKEDKPKKRSHPTVESFLDAPELLDAKRKRTVPKEEQKLKEWLKENFISDAEGTLSGLRLYDLFTETCVVSGLNVPDLNIFKRILSEVIGEKPYKIAEGSGYKGIVKEIKKKPVSEKKVAKDDSIKIKDVILEALKEGGSPKKGLRFSWIKQYIIGKYPTFSFDVYPKYLKVALDRCVRSGAIELVKGIGLVGYFRLPGEYPETEDEKKKKTKKAEKKEGDEKDGETKEGDAKENGDAKGDGDTKEGEDGKKEKEKTGDEAKDDEKKDKDAKEKKKKKKKQLNARRRKVMSHGVSIHVEPQTISDTFPMAMTFMSEPKDASVLKIKKYIERYFQGSDTSNHRMKAALLSGCEKGVWEQVTGSATISGTYRLQVDDLNPNHCKTIEDMICLAMLACHEPKQSSVNLLKTYVMEYHPNFNVDKRPYLFKKAVEKGEKRGNIIRLSGIGSSGSFQLANPFTPCPAWLAGMEDSDVEEEEEEILEYYVPEKEPAYKARPSKRRGMARVSAAKGRQPDFVSYSTAAPKQAVRHKKRKPKVKYAANSESESDEVEAPPPKRSKSRSKPATEKTAAKKRPTPKEKSLTKKTKKSSTKKSKSLEVEKGDEEEEEVSKPSKSGRKKPQYREDSEKEESEEEMVAVAPRKSPVKKGSAKKPAKRSSVQSSQKSPARSSRERVNYSEVVDRDEEDHAVRSTQSRSRGTPSKSYIEVVSSDEEGEVVAKSHGKKKAPDPEDESEDEQPSKSKAKSSSKKRQRGSDDELEEERPSKSKSSSKKRQQEPEDESEDERPSKSKSKSSSKKKTLESDDEFEEEKPSKSKSSSKTRDLEPESDDDYEDKRPSKPKSKSSSKTRDLEPESDDDYEDKRPSKSKPKSSSKKRYLESEDESDYERPSKSKSSAKKLTEKVSDSEEEGEVRSSQKRSYASDSDEDPPPKQKSTKKSPKKSSKKRLR